MCSSIRWKSMGPRDALKISATSRKANAGVSPADPPTAKEWTWVGADGVVIDLHARLADNPGLLSRIDARGADTGGRGFRRHRPSNAASGGAVRLSLCPRDLERLVSAEVGGGSRSIHLDLQPR